jgi:hypothetical protein
VTHLIKSIIDEKGTNLSDMFADNSVENGGPVKLTVTILIRAWSGQEISGGDAGMRNLPGFLVETDYFLTGYGADVQQGACDWK